MDDALHIGDQSQPPKPNPLFLEPVLEVVFNHLPMQDLDSCISVCKVWSKEAKRAKKRRITVELSSPTDLVNLMKKIESSTDLVNELVTNNLCLEDPQFGKLLSTIQPTLSTLALTTGLVSLRTLHRCLIMLSSLTRLEIGALENVDGLYPPCPQLFPVYDESQREVTLGNLKSLEFITFNTPLSAALKTFPNLTELTVANLGVERLSNFKGIEMPRLEKLKIMNRRCAEIDDKHFEMLMPIKFPVLNMLCLYNIKKTVNVNFIKTFLEKHKEGLQTLDLRYFSNESDIPQPPSINLFPVDLPNLTTLYISKPHVLNIYHVFNSCPKLNCLCLNEPKANWITIFPKKMKEQPSLLSLILTSIEAQHFQIVAKAFSSVLFLSVHNCDDNILRAICSHMPQLKYLKCYAPKDQAQKLTSEGLTGIRPTVFANKSLDPKDNRTKEPYIANLINLNFLHINFFNPYEPWVIKGFFEYGLLEVPNLKCAKIDGITLEEDFLVFLQEDCGCRVRRSKKQNAEGYIIYFGEIIDSEVPSFTPCEPIEQYIYKKNC